MFYVTPQQTTLAVQTVVENSIKIKRVRFKNFKLFKDISIPFSDFNVLVGVNNAGKSTILQGIYACFDFLKQSSASPEFKRIACDVSFFHVPKSAQIWFDNKWSTGKGHIPVVFEIEFNDGVFLEFSLNMYYSWTHINLTKKSEGLTREHIQKILDSTPVLVPGFVGLLVKEEYRTIARRNQLIMEGRHTEVLRNILLDIKTDVKKFDTLNQLISKYFNINLNKVEFKELEDSFIKVEYGEGEHDLDLISSGSGFLQILQLLSFILIHKTSILLLDEPDAHLHPSLQRTLISILTDLQKELNLQVILSTHSKEIINNVDPSQVIPISKDTVTATGLTDYRGCLELLHELGSLDNIDAAQMLRSKKILFLEGKTDNIIKSIANLSGYTLFNGASPYVVIPRGGVDYNRPYDDAKLFCEVLGQQLYVYSIIDGDYRLPVEKIDYITKSKAKGVEVFVLNKKEIENYLLNNELLLTTINRKLKEKGEIELSMPELTELLNAICDSLKNDVNDNIYLSLKRYFKTTDKRYDDVTILRKSRLLLESKWKSLEDKKSLCSGKDILSKLNQSFTEKKIHISAPQLLYNMKREDIEKELLDMLSKMRP